MSVEQGYKPVLDALREAGYQPRVEHTGGGCYGIALDHNGRYVFITESEDVLSATCPWDPDMGWHVSFNESEDAFFESANEQPRRYSKDGGVESLLALIDGFFHDEFAASALEFQQLRKNASPDWSRCTCGPGGKPSAQYDVCRQLGCDPDCPVC